jgi:antitoxin component YwqK of YwqJK toxin-antitoxin module
MSSYFVYDYFRECPDKRLSETEYVGNVKHGQYRKYNLQGDCILRGGYKNNGFHGPTYKYYDDGSVMEICNYENGSLTGEYNTYYPNGKLASFATFLPHNEFYRIVGPRIHGPQIVYHEDGSIKKTCIWHRGEFVGPLYSYYESGRTCESLQRHGNLGVYTKYTRTGELSCYYEIRFVDHHETYFFAYGHRASDTNVWSSFNAENKHLHREMIWIPYVPHGYWMECFTGRFFPEPKIHLYYYNMGREQYEECQEMKHVDYRMVFDMFGIPPENICMHLTSILETYTAAPELNIVYKEEVAVKAVEPQPKKSPKQTPKKKAVEPPKKVKVTVQTKSSNPFSNLTLDSDDDA